MTHRRRSHAHLLRWYPARWRERYGEEFLAVMEDELEERAYTFRYRWAVAGAGLQERVRASGLVGGADARTRLTAGSLLVLSTWTLFVLGGIGFQKTSEHFARSLHGGVRASSQDAFNVVVIFAVISAIVVAMGVAATVPSVAKFITSGGWKQIKAHVLRSGFASALVVASIVPLSIWAHRLSEVQRNGGDPAYSGALVAWATLVALTLVSWTVMGIALATRVNLSRAVLRFEGALAVAVTASMATITCATALWWTDVAAHASWFFQGSPSTPPTTSVNMVVTVSVMAGAVVVALVGVFHIASSWRRCSTDPVAVSTVGS